MTVSPSRSLAAVAILALLVLPTVPRAQQPPQPPPKRLNRSATPAPGEKKLDWLAFDAAADLAAKENKHMIVDVYTTWCGWCRVMERETYANPEVADYLEKNFVLTKVNGESSSKLHYKGQELTERDFARGVGVTGFPTTFFLKPDLEVLGGVPGFIQPKEFMIYARYVGTRWYEKGKIQDFVQQQKQQQGSAPQ